MNIRNRNRAAWNRLVKEGNRWTIPVSAEEITNARQDQWEIYLTPSKPIPKDWLTEIAGLKVLCLASGGGQQGPILAAAGAQVTVFDNSPEQLGQDISVAERDALTLDTVEGDMQDLSVFNDESFDMIINPVSNCFVPDVGKVWAETFRVLRGGGELLAGFINPVDYAFDANLEQKGVYQLKYSLPYSDLTSITKEERVLRYGETAPLEFGHTLEDQIGGQLNVGFAIIGFYEDHRTGEKIAEYLPSFIVTRAKKLL